VYSGYRVATPPDKAVKGTLMGYMPGQLGVFYFDVQFEYEEIGPGIRPRIRLIRGKSDGVEEPVAAEAEA